MESDETFLNDVIMDELKFILRSEIKIDILSYLYYENLTIKELSEKGLNYGSVSTNIKQLEEKGYLYKKNKRYKLNNGIKRKMANLLYLNEEINNISNFDDYLNSHLLKSKSLKSLSQLPLSTDYEIISNTPLNPYNVVNNFSKNMSEEGIVKCIFTHVHPEFQIVNKQDSKTETQLNILVSKEIKDYLILNKQKTSKNLENRTIKIKAINPVKLSLTVTEKEAMFVLYNKDGTYDTNAGIISSDPEFITWGNRLFDEIESHGIDEYVVLNSI